MKKFEEKLSRYSVLCDVICDICGDSCKTTAPYDDFEYATLSAQWGYFSKKDGSTTKIHMCEECFDAVMKIIGPAIAATKEKKNDQSRIDRSI